MNTTPALNSRRNSIVVAIGLLVLLLGTATSNAFVMLAMALVALAVIALFYRHELGRIGLLVMTLAAAAATVVAIAITRF